MADNFTMDDQGTQPQPGTSPSQPGIPPSQPGMPQSPPQPTPFPQMVLGAVEAHFVAEHTRAVANVNNYLQNPAGIGEHPDIVEECIVLFEKLSHAEGALESIRKSIP